MFEYMKSLCFRFGLFSFGTVRVFDFRLAQKYFLLGTHYGYFNDISHKNTLNFDFKNLVRLKFFFIWNFSLEFMIDWIFIVNFFSCSQLIYQFLYCFVLNRKITAELKWFTKFWAYLRWMILKLFHDNQWFNENILHMYYFLFFE